LYRVLRKQFQKSLTKQGLKFKLSTKVLSAEKKDGKVVVTTEAAKDGKQDTVCISWLLDVGWLTGSTD
jgi:dihydrolipoamide dehydrogenase